MIDPTLLTTTCQIYRPFGASSPLHSNVPTRFIPDLACGRPPSEVGALWWDSYIDVQPGTDIVDGCTRSPGTDGTLYADGDEVRIPSGVPSPRYVVVWREIRNQGTPDDFIRVYLLRDTL